MSERPCPVFSTASGYFRYLQTSSANALKFTSSGGVVTVRADRVGDELRVSVLDTGTGIAVDKLEEVFERFWQVGKNDREGSDSAYTSLGASWTRTAGRIWAESTLGIGSAFHFTIPLTLRGSA